MQSFLGIVPQLYSPAAREIGFPGTVFVSVLR